VVQDAGALLVGKRMTGRFEFDQRPRAHRLGNLTLT
jgi:hypothetical protein